MNISESDVHLWYVYNEDIRDSNLLFQYYNILNEDERRQQNRFHSEKDRHQYLITRVAIRTILSEYVREIEPAEWIFNKNSYGKPYIDSMPSDILNLSFNISHTNQLIVIAITLERAIGVDVENMSRAEEVSDIAEYFFSPIEKKQLFSLSSSKFLNRFYDLWTLKEAYIKALGMGLSIPLDCFSFSFCHRGKINLSLEPQIKEHTNDEWRFWQVQPSGIYKVSIAMKSNCPVTKYSLSIRNIIPLIGVNEMNSPSSYGNLLFS